MTSMNRRQLTNILLASSLSTGVLGACATTEDGKKIPFASLDKILESRSRAKAEKLAVRERALRYSITSPERKTEFDKLWGNINKNTDAIEMSDNRIRIKSQGTLFAGDDISEQNFFIRAAAETLKTKKSGFVIKQIDFYKDKMPWASWGSKLNLSTKSWIGNYEDFRENRNEQNIFSSRSSIRNKALDGVILLLDDDEFPNRDRFDAADIYLNLLNYKSR